MSHTEIQILARILVIFNRHKYQDDDGFAVNLSKVFIKNIQSNNFLNESEKIKTSFFRRNNAYKKQFLTALFKELSSLKISNEDLRFPRQISIDDIDSFSKIKKIKMKQITYIDILENDIKNAFLKIMNEPYEHKDWGGEQSDIFTTRLKLNGRRISTAIALNGRGKLKAKKKEGIFTVGDAGKNGDQIVRLFREPANLFILQCVGKFDNHVYVDMSAHAYQKSKGGIEEVYYCLIDGNDTNRILEAI